MRLIQKIFRSPTRIMRSHVDSLDSVFVGEVTSLPGCADVAVSHAMFCQSGKGRGNAAKAARMRLHQMQELGYMAVICTVVEGNVAQEKTLERTGYTKLMSYKSQRTGNTVWLWGRELDHA